MKAAGKTKTPPVQRALLCLHDGGYNGISAGEVGASVWPERECRPGRGVSVNGGGDYAAQMLLGRLKKAGLVEYAASEGSSRWRLSEKGRSEVRQLRDEKPAQTAKPPPKPQPRETGPLPCVCGCAIEEHGHDDEHPGSTSCTACEDCIAYEADPGEDA
jgi:hypothetical protein